MAYAIGDPNHIAVHNNLVTEVQTLANRAGVEVILPDVAGLGDTGHTDDHNLIVAAIQAIADAGGAFPWAKVSGGTVTTVNNADGSVDEVHTFTADGTLTVESPGYARVFLISGGSGSVNNLNGSGGRVVTGLHPLPAGPLPVTVGAGGLLNYLAPASSIGTLTTYVSAGAYGGAGGTSVATPGDPLSTDISGSAVTYGQDGSKGAPRANRGDGGPVGQPGSSGIVIVRVQKSAPTVSGVAATGGTVTEYTGDGTNGVAGQKYRCHTFYESGSLAVAQGGPARVLFVGGASSQASGDGGEVAEYDIPLSPGTLPVVVGGTGEPNATLRTYIGSGSYGVSGAAGNQTYGAGRRLPTSTTGQEGVWSSITGTAIQHGGGVPANSTAASRGVGGMLAAGTTPQDTKGRGVVIVRYEVEA